MDFTLVASDLCLVEAPLERDGDVWFTELLLGGIRRLSPDGTVTSYLTERHHVGGLAFNADGRLIHSGPGGLHWFDPASGKGGPLLDAIDGVPLAGINDFQPDGMGGAYFGTLGSGGDYDEGPKPSMLCHVTADLQVRVLDPDLAFGNGIGISPDRTKLYHNESTLATFVYDLAPDGTVSNKRKFVDRYDPDGMAMDAQGGVWIAHYDSGEIARYLPDGTLDRREALPHKAVISLAFGGPDLKDLYVTTAGNEGIDALLKGELPPQEAGVFKARCDIAGAPFPTTAFQLPPL